MRSTLRPPISISKLHASQVAMHTARDPLWRGPKYHDDVIKWKHFLRYWPFVRGIHRSPVNSPHKGQWRAALMSSLICAWINGWVNNREAGDLRRHRTNYDVTVMIPYMKSMTAAKHQSALKLAKTLFGLTGELRSVCRQHFAQNDHFIFHIPTFKFKQTRYLSPIDLPCWPRS